MRFPIQEFPFAKSDVVVLSGRRIPRDPHAPRENQARKREVMAARSTAKTRARSGADSKTSKGASPDKAPTWTFLTNHTHVLLCLHEDPELTLREVSQRVGITERSVQRILSELEEGGFVTRERVGLRNRYRFKTNVALRHPIEAHCKIGDLINMVEGKGR